MEKIAKFFVSVVFVGGWFLGLIFSFNYTTVMGHPWFIYYLIATFVVWVSLRFAFKEDIE
jgi:hypothetical protein